MVDNLMQDKKLATPLKLQLNTGAEIPVLGLGVWQIPAGVPTESSVKWALKHGYRHIDTARIYGNEASVGKAIRESGIPRSDIFVTTKLWPFDAYDTDRALEESLDKLGLDHVDLYLVHWPMPLFSKHIWRRMERLAERGGAKAIGVSNYSVSQLQTLLSFANVAPAVNQVRMSAFTPKVAMRKLCTKNGVVVEAYSPLTRGKKLDHEQLTRIADANGRTPAQVLLRWAVQLNVVILPKSTHESRIAENGALFDFSLSDEDMQRLSNLET